MSDESAPASVAGGPSSKGTDNHHTIALIQPSKHDSTRFYRDFGSTLEATEGMLQLYETRLKESNPGAAAISYDFNSLCQFIDDMKELCLLSWDASIQGYKRYDRAWVKSAIQEHLTSLAQPGRR